MRSVQVSKPKGPLEIVERDIPEPEGKEARIKVQACSLCHSESRRVKNALEECSN
jgi:D-arabinose 1-dehydrogenase-like Zn-dependent alcohol dehydrogenase